MMTPLAPRLNHEMGPTAFFFKSIPFFCSSIPVGLSTLSQKNLIPVLSEPQTSRLCLGAAARLARLIGLRAGARTRSWDNNCEHRKYRISETSIRIIAVHVHLFYLLIHFDEYYTDFALKSTGLVFIIDKGIATFYKIDFISK